mmetsp:Transcript_41362/g.62759  ORF Transcript_41362/g.62759 Transcript_41362/m.62759 type:complete len:460 (-) Transcript_41362:208-1587(-)
MERLRHELLHLTSTGDNKLIFFRKLIHTKNGNNILKTLVILEKLLGGTCDLVVVVSNHTRVKHTGGGVKGIYSGVNSKLCNGTRKHSGSVKMGKGGGGGRIGKIISRHVNSLHRGNGSLGSGGNTLLKPTHVCGECGLVSYSGRNTSKKGRHLGTGLGEAENVVNEEKHILSLLVTEVFGNGKTGKSDTSTGTRGLVHLSVDKSSLGSLGGASGLIDLNDASLNHLVVEIVTLARALSDSGENGVSSVVHGNVVDELHDNDRLSDSGSAKETNLSSLGVRGEQVHHLDSGDENLLGLSLLGEGGRRPVQRRELLRLLVGEDGSLLVHGLTNYVDDTAQGLGAHRHLDGGTAVHALLTADKTVRGLHRNGAHGVLSEMLSHLEDKTLISLGDFHLQRVQNLWEFLIELNIHNGSNHLSHLSGAHCGGGTAEGAGPSCSFYIFRISNLDGSMSNDEVMGAL